MPKYKFLDTSWAEFGSPRDFIETSTEATADRDGEIFIDDQGNEYTFLLVTTGHYMANDA